MEKCNKCSSIKELTIKGKCRNCQNIAQRVYRSEISNKVTKKYEKTEKGYLVRTYRNMLSRVKGVQKKKRHLYEGLPILDKEDFYKWSLSSNYPKLLENYEASDYNLKLAPSIDRKDPVMGYTIDNIRWVTHSQNSSDTRQKGKLKNKE